MNGNFTLFASDSPNINLTGFKKKFLNFKIVQNSTQFWQKIYSANRMFWDYNSSRKYTIKKLLDSLDTDILH